MQCHQYKAKKPHNKLLLSFQFKHLLVKYLQHDKYVSILPYYLNIIKF